MPRLVQTAVLEDAHQVRDLGAKLMGLPAVGTNAGAGAHVVPGAAPATGETKPGWTSFHTGVFDVGGLTPYHIEVDDFETEIVLDAARPAEEQRLSDAERATLAGLLAGAVTV